MTRTVRTIGVLLVIWALTASAETGGTYDSRLWLCGASVQPEAEQAEPEAVEPKYAPDRKRSPQTTA